MGSLVNRLARSLPSDPRGGRRKAKAPAFSSEAELAAVVVAHLREQGWTVFQEVELGRRSGGERADIVAVRGDELAADGYAHKGAGWAKPGDVLVVECKLSLSLDLLAQADHWLDYASLVAIAFPLDRGYGRARRFGESLARSRGLGMFEVAPAVGDRLPARIVSETEPKRSERVIEVLAKKLAAALCPEQQDYAAAGNAEGKRWTPWRDSITRARAIVLEHPGIGTKELVQKLGKHHWASDGGARAGLVDAAERGIFERVVARQGKGKRWQFFPEGQVPEGEIEAAPSVVPAPAQVGLGWLVEDDLFARAPAPAFEQPLEPSSAGAIDAPIVMVDAITKYPNAKGIFRNGSAHLTVNGTTPEHLEALHAFAQRIGLRRSWFQDHRLAAHYDLTPARHVAALRAGALLVDAHEQARRRIEARKAAP